MNNERHYVFAIEAQLQSSWLIMLTSIAARGGGGSFKRLKIYNSEEHVPIEIVCVTCFNPSHFEEPIFSTCAYRKTAKKEFDRNMHC